MLGIDRETQIGGFNFDGSLRPNHHIDLVLSYVNGLKIAAHIDLVIALTKVQRITMLLRPLTLKPLPNKKSDNEHGAKDL